MADFSETLAAIDLSREKMVEVKDFMRDQFAKGFELGKGNGHTDAQIKMLNSYIMSPATGREKGIFYAVDIGGTNLRIIRVELFGDGSYNDDHNDEFKVGIPKKLMHEDASAEELFDYIADQALVLFNRYEGKESSGYPGGARPSFPVGFTFSFPCSQTAVNRGILMEWTKGFATKGCVGQDPALLLDAAFERKKLPMQVAVLVNDTVGVLMGCSYTRPHTKAGLILGTGCNIAFVDEAAGQIVNSEWAGCGSARDGSATVISELFTEADKAVDKASPNPGRQYFEKLISGFYIGEIVRRTFAARYSNIAELQDCKPQDGGVKKMKAKHVSYICADVTKDHLLTKEQVADVWYLEEDKWTDEMLTELRQLCAAARDRAAKLCASGIAALFERLNPASDEPVAIGVDGSLYRLCTGFKDVVRTNLEVLLGKEKADQIKLHEVDDGSGQGAVICCASLDIYSPCSNRNK